MPDVDQELLELTRSLVAENTVSVAGKNGDVQTQSTVRIADIVCDRLESGGFTVRRFPYSTNNVDKVNIIATKGGDEPHLALSGHMDVVPVGAWDPSPDPFRLTEQNGRFYARGVADMKLFDACAILAASRVPVSDLKRPLAVYLTSDEEVGCLGIKQLLKRRRGDADTTSEFKVVSPAHEEVPIPKYVIIGEPTGFVPMYMHKGYLFMRVFIRTQKEKPGHSSDPKSGASVIKTGLPEVLVALNRLERELQEIKDNRFAVPYPTTNPGVVGMGSGAAKNILATSCWIDFEARALPSTSPEDLFRTVSETVSRAVHGIPGIEASVQYMRSPTPPMETPIDSPVVQTARQLSGNKPQTVAYNTEGGTFNRYGAECVIFGPGSIAQAHTRDEYVDARWMQSDVLDLYERFIRTMCR